MEAIELLRKYWGYDSFRECQAEIIDSVLEGHDTIGLLPTGGGKSVTFQIPALMLDGITIVVTPLISLMKDQVDNLRARGIGAACIHSGMTRAERRLSLDRIRLGRVKLLYISPEKLAMKDFIADLSQWNVCFIVVDEAHCISQWGYDFRPSYLNLSKLRNVFPDIPVLALTASATPEVVADIADKLGMENPAVLSRSFSRSNISYIVRHTEEKDIQLLRILSRTTGSGIVYVRSRKRTAQLAAFISEHGISADFYHAGLEAHDKTEKQDRWKDDTTRIMVATNAFGMGIDKPDVRIVVHYDLPSSLEEYYQEAGRAGRDGKESYAVVLASQADKGLLKRRISENFPGREYILNIYERVGNYLNVGIGEGYDKVYEFNLTGFLATFRLKPIPTLAALHTLTRAGAFEFDENFNSRSRINLLVDKRDLYDLRLDDTTDNVLQAVLRSYTGLFADYIPIDEVRIGMMAKCTPQQVYDAMLLLSRMKVLSYIPRSNQPFIYYPTSRDLPKHVVITKSVYEDLLERAVKRMEAMRDYIYGDGVCRVSRMLAYFGEKNPADCGKCDYCREKSRAGHAEQINADVEKRLVKAINDHPEGLSIDMLRDMFVPRQLSAAIAFLRQMTDDGELRLANNTFYPNFSKD